METVKLLQDLHKAMSVETYDVAPSALRQADALMIEDVSGLYHTTTYEDKHIFLQKDLKVEKVKSVTVQFVRKLSHGRFGGSARAGGAIGRERTSDWTRVAVPMCYYSEIRRVTLPATFVSTQGGDKIEDVEADSAELNLAGDIEFDCFRGCDDFSNAGTFDGNPNAVPSLPNIRGLQLQIRQSDSQLLAQDLMFLAYGAGLSSAISVGGTLTQESMEDASVRSNMAHGSALDLLVDPLVQSAYNQIAFEKERIVLAGSPQEMTGADLRRQSTMNGMVQVKSSRFLSGKFRPFLPQDGAPNAPSISAAVASGSTTFVNGQSYVYIVTAENDEGEGPRSSSDTQAIGANGQEVTITITPSGSGSTAKFFNVYRSGNGGSEETARFIGRVANTGASTVDFVDLNNKIPGFVTGVLVQQDTMDLAELAPYSRMKLAVSDLSIPEAHFRFLTLRVTSPKKNVLLDNLRGTF